MLVSPRSDLGGAIKAVFCGAINNSGEPLLATAAGTGDNTEVQGASIDRLGYDSAVVVVAYNTSLTADKTLSIAVEIEDSADNSSWDTAVVLQAATVEETGTAGTGSNNTGVVEIPVDLRGYSRYVRFNFTPDLSHSGTDTVDGICVALLGGADKLAAA